MSATDEKVPFPAAVLGSKTLKDVGYLFVFSTVCGTFFVGGGGGGGEGRWHWRGGVRREGPWEQG